MLFSFTLLPPVVVDFIYQENSAEPVKNSKSDLRLRDGFIVVVLFWFILSVSGTLPLMLYEQLDITLTDAFFESVSGLTTTGATAHAGYWWYAVI